MKHKVIPSHFFTVKEQSLVSLVCQGKSRFIIPYNQRPWSWKEKQITDLWADILKTTNHFFDTSSDISPWAERQEPIGDAHFLGAFVFEAKGNDYSVVDGQQRLTSITMIVSALRTAMTTIQSNQRGSFKKTVTHYLENFRSWMIADFSDDILFPRLCVDSNYSDFFTGYIIEADSIDERDAFLEESDIDFSQEPVLNSFKKSFDIITGLINDHLNDLSSDEVRYSAIKSIFSAIENCFICIAADVKQESFSYEVFKCLNAKGLPLSQADKLKNELFTQSEIIDHELIKKHWDTIQENTPYSAVSQFIRIRYVALKGECPDSRLHSIITENELSKGSVVDLVAEWAKDSLMYSHITLHQSPSDKNSFTDIESSYLEDLKSLNITLSSILTFSAYKKFFKKDRKKFVELLRLTRNFCFRVLTICKKDTGYLELHLGKAARDIMAGESVKNIRSTLRKASTDNEFEEAFRTASAKTAKQQFFILNSMEIYYLKESALKTKPHGDELNVEHIMPKKFDKNDSKRSKEWLWAKDDEESHKSYINRLGNLCLLEGDVNRDVSSFDYEAKVFGTYPECYIEKKGGIERKSYKDSDLPSIKRIIEKYSQWNFNVIQERQNELAKDAVLIWTLNSES